MPRSLAVPGSAARGTGSPGRARRRRPGRRAGAPAGAGVGAVLLLAACGGGVTTTSPGGAATSAGATTSSGATTSPGATPSRGASSAATAGTVTAPAAPNGPTDLTIVLDPGGGARSTWTLTCDPAGGNHPSPAQACASLASRGESALAPVKRDQMCTQIFGGEQTATISGTWRGEPVTAMLSRANGCEIERWDSLKGLLPPGGA